MKIQSISSIIFNGKPSNYGKIDEHVSRSAQPQKEDLTWLKEQGITDVINFRTMYSSGIDFNERQVVKDLGMNYHNIPSITHLPLGKNIAYFLKLVEKISQKGGKVHIHCKAGADRTGMYAFIYKSIKGIGTMAENESEWIRRGHNRKLYPNLMSWTKNFLQNYKSK